MKFDFTGKTVLITGAASGMGAATARLFADCGADVLIADRNAEQAQQIANAIGAHDPLIGDVSARRIGQPSITVHNHVLDTVSRKQGRGSRARRTCPDDQHISFDFRHFVLPFRAI